MKEKKEANCKACGTVFISTIDHGVFRKFCSRVCFCAGAVFFNCDTCGKQTRDRKSRPRLNDRKYCSQDCKKQDTVNRTSRVCVVCGDTFLKRTQKRTGLYCSQKCVGDANSRENSKAWNGGIVNGANNTLKIRINKKYRPLHRAVVESVIGRDLKKDEIVVHISGIKLDNSPSNLYVGDWAELRALNKMGYSQLSSNIEPLTYMRTKARGQTGVYQLPKIPLANGMRCRPPTGEWTTERKLWIKGDRDRKSQTRGSPHIDIPDYSRME